MKIKKHELMMAYHNLCVYASNHQNDEEIQFIAKSFDKSLDYSEDVEKWEKEQKAIKEWKKQILKNS